MRWVKDKYTVISTQNLASNVTHYLQVRSAGHNIMALKPLDWWLQAIQIQLLLMLL